MRENPWLVPCSNSGRELVSLHFSAFVKGHDPGPSRRLVVIVAAHAQVVSIQGINSRSAVVAVGAGRPEELICPRPALPKRLYQLAHI